VNRVSLVPTDVQATRLGFGCGGLMRTPSRRERQRLLGAVFDLGVRHFDVARSYGLGAAERELGRFLRARRDEVTVATKFGLGPLRRPGVAARAQAPLRAVLRRAPSLRSAVKHRAGDATPTRRYDAAVARASLELSLRELGTSHVDLLLLHGAERDEDVDFEGIGEWLEGARARGEIRAWGVAGGPPSLPVIARLRPPAVAQLHYDILDPGRDRVAAAAPAVAFGALGVVLPALCARMREGGELAAAWRAQLGVPAEPAAIAGLLWQEALATHPEATVLFGTSDVEHARENVEAAAREPDAEQLERLRQLVRGLEPARSG
jgi:aryl-alcohol dehydrogenase-like predicted oxidoreductase